MKIVIIEEKRNWASLKKLSCSKIQVLPKNPKKGIHENSVGILMMDEDVNTVKMDQIQVFDVEATSLKEKIEVLGYPVWIAKSGFLQFTCDPETCGDYLGLGGGCVKRASKWTGMIIRYQEPKLIWLDEEMEVGEIEGYSKFNVKVGEKKDGIKMNPKMFERIPKSMKGESAGNKWGKTHWVAPWFDLTNLIK